MGSVLTARSRPALDDALSGAVDWLLARQDPQGWWCGELQTNVTMTAEHVLLLRFLGLPVEDIREGAIRHILQNQRADGSWALYMDGPGDLSTTTEAYMALRVLGVDPGLPEMKRALRFTHALGGAVGARVFTKIWLALFGQYPWEGVPSMPPELVYLPLRAPLNLYDFACWARGTIAGLLIVISRRPVRPLGCDVSELILPGTEAQLTRVPGSGPFWWADRAQKLYERLSRHPFREAARARLVSWILERQEADGSWGGIQPPWVYSLIALNLEGFGVDHPVMRRGLAGLDKFSLRDAEGWRLQACMSPIWDTAWAVIALRKAGLDPDAEPVVKATRWLLREQIFGPGDWQVRVPVGDPGSEGGGWAFEFENDLYPDVDDTALVVLALLQGPAGAERDAAVEKAAQWVTAMRSRDGAWAAFDRDNVDQLVYRLPFADFGAMLDPPTEDVTAHVLEMLARLGRSSRDPAVAEGLTYLRQSQRSDGSWWGRWGVNHVYGTWCVIAALTAFPQRSASLQGMIDRGVAWTVARQNPDGGWGETCHSYVDPSFAGVGVSTASQTAWAVNSLQLARQGRHPSCLRGLEYLLAGQLAGTWAEPQYTGTGFPRDFYINYHLYRHIFPLLALAQAR